MIPQDTATMRKFGHPETLIGELSWWAALYRPKQVTLGSVVLAAKAEVSAFADLPAAAFAELGDAVRILERCLAAFAHYDKINYLMLMMVDPHPHFHVIPRYEGERTFGGVAYPDHGWPGVPTLDRAIEPVAAAKADAIAALQALWRKNSAG